MPPRCSSLPSPNTPEASAKSLCTSQPCPPLSPLPEPPVPLVASETSLEPLHSHLLTACTSYSLCVLPESPRPRRILGCTRKHEVSSQLVKGRSYENVRACPVLVSYGAEQGRTAASPQGEMRGCSPGVGQQLGTRTHRSCQDPQRHLCHLHTEPEAHRLDPGLLEYPKPYFPMKPTTVM